MAVPYSASGTQPSVNITSERIGYLSVAGDCESGSVRRMSMTDSFDVSRSG